MNIQNCIGCPARTCAGVNHDCYRVPNVALKPEAVSIVLVSEAAAPEAENDYYAGGESLYEHTTVLAFNEAGANVTSIKDLLALGVYFTTAVKCGKLGYGLPTAAIRHCSLLLEQELALFPNVKAILLMGDAAIAALNAIARRAGRPRVIPAISTYKLRGQKFMYQGQRVFPSYLQAGPSFFIEKSKRAMIAQDIAAALRLAH